MRREIFADEIHIFHLKALAAKRLETACVGGKRERQPVGIESLELPVIFGLALPYFPSPSRG